MRPAALLHSISCPLRTIGRICFVMPEAIGDDVLPELMTTLHNGLNEEPKIASHVCWVGGHAVRSPRGVLLSSANSTGNPQSGRRCPGRR